MLLSSPSILGSFHETRVMVAVGTGNSNISPNTNLVLGLKFRKFLQRGLGVLQRGLQPPLPHSWLRACHNVACNRAANCPVIFIYIYTRGVAVIRIYIHIHAALRAV